MPSDQRGFSLIELLVSVAILTATAGVLFHFATRAQLVAAAQPDAADVHQRLRVAVGMIQRDLANAGAAPLNGANLRALVNYLPPIVPARMGAREADPELTAFTDRISLLTVAQHGWQAGLAADMAAADAPLQVTTGPGCPGGGLCGFVVGTRVAILDRSRTGAGHDVFSVTDISGGLAHGSPNPPFSRTYAAVSAAVFPIVQHVYYRDAASNRLMLYDGYQTDVPLVDNVVDLRFTYFADPEPASAPRPAAGTFSCVYAAGDPPVPLLQPLAGATLVALTLAQMSDGPLCGTAPSQFDGDLLRIRRVRVTLRVQATARGLRASGEHFTNPGTSRGGESAVRDYEMTFDVWPRSMSPTR